MREECTYLCDRDQETINFRGGHFVSSFTDVWMQEPTQIQGRKKHFQREAAPHEMLVASHGST
jgi:hypothetical protein